MKDYIQAMYSTKFENEKVMNKMLIVVGFIVLFVGGLLYTLLPRARI